MYRPYRQEVETLANLALNRSLYTLKSAIGRLPTLKMSFYSAMFSSIEEKLDSYNNWKQVNEIVEYHRPHREFLNSTQKYEDYFQLLNWRLYEG